MTNEFDDSDELGLRLGRPGRRRALAAADPRDAGRPPILSGARPDESVAGGPGGPPPRLTARAATGEFLARRCTAHGRSRTAPRPAAAVPAARRRTMGTRTKSPSTHLELAVGTLRTYSSRPPVEGRPAFVRGARTAGDHHLESLRVRPIAAAARHQPALRGRPRRARGRARRQPRSRRSSIIVGPVDSSTASVQGRWRTPPTPRPASTRRTSSRSTPRTRPGRPPRQALQGASIVVYIGHGNGFPSPYRSSPWPYSQNGLGLEPEGRRRTTARPSTTASTTWPSDVRPRAERGRPPPSPLLRLRQLASPASPSRRLSDGPASGSTTWPPAGSRRAPGRSSPRATSVRPGTSRQLFTTHKTIDRICHDSPTFNDNAFTFASTRTAGRDGRDGPGRDGERLLAGRDRLAGHDDRRRSPAPRTPRPTSIRPRSSPGQRHRPGRDRRWGVGGVYPDATITDGSGTMLPPSTIAGGTKLRLLAKGTEPSFDGSAAYEVGTFARR